MIDLFGTDIAPAAIVLVLVLLGLMKGEESDPSFKLVLEGTFLLTLECLASRFHSAVLQIFSMQLSTIIVCSCYGATVCLLKGKWSRFDVAHKGLARIDQET